MRIIQVHNYYGSEAPSGENAVVDAERRLLEKAGHSVELFSRHSDSIRKLKYLGLVAGALATPWNPFSARALREHVKTFNPDVVHVHNTFPLISPSIFPALRGHAPRVLTLHNYRLFCAAGIPLRHGKLCTLCIENHSVRPALRFGCYRGSKLATWPLAANIAFNRALGTWQKEVDAFIVFSEFQRDMVINAGLPAELVHIKPNFYTGNPEILPWSSRDGEIVFVGRLTREKGTHTLIEAWRHWGANAPKLVVIGDGDERKDLENSAQGLPVTFLGQVASAVAIRAIANARLMVLPSETFEGFPMVIGEAFAHATPVAVSDIGPLPALVQPVEAGIAFPPGDAAALFRTVSSLWSQPVKLAEMSQNARHAFENAYTEEANLKRLIEIYDTAKQVADARIRKGARG